MSASGSARTIPPGLKLLTELIKDHNRDRGDEHELIPVLHEQIEEDIALLSAGARRCGGTLFDLDKQDKEWDPPKGPLHTDRHTIVTSLLDSAKDAGHLPASVIIEVDNDGNAHARLDGIETPVEPSLRPILRAAAIVASSAYDEYSLIMTATEFAPTDSDRRLLLYSLLTLNPALLNIKGLCTTIVPIFGGGLDPTTDYRRLPPLRYVVRRDRVLKRSADSQALNISRIADLQGRPIVLFLGAGASASAGIPLGDRYRDVALDALVGHYDDKRVSAEKFYDLLHHRGHLLANEDSRERFVKELTLERVLLETFTQDAFRARADVPVIKDIIEDSARALEVERGGRRAIRQLAQGLPGQLILMTVNFDQLIEDGLPVDHSLFFKTEHYKDEEKLVELVAYAGGDSSKRTPVMKLHGSIEDPQSLIATIDRTSAGLDDGVLDALNKVLLAASKPLMWIWVGCSMRDRDVNRWLGGLPADALDEWWVDPMPGESLDACFAEQRASRWAQVGLKLEDRVLIDSADGFLRKLSEEIASM